MVRILAATDFTEDNRPVLDFTANMVRQTGGKMYLLHAVEPCMMDAAGSMAADDMLGGFATVPMIEDVPDNTVLTMADRRAKMLAEAISMRFPFTARLRRRTTL